MYYRGGGAPSLCPAAAENVLLEEGGRHGYLLEPANPLLISTSGGLPSAEDATLPGLPTSPLKTRRTLAAPRKDLFLPPLGQVLLHLGASVEAAEVNGYTALTLAVFSDRSSAVELLVERGAQLDVRDSHGRTALHHAAEHSSLHCVNVLVSR